MSSLRNMNPSEVMHHPLIGTSRYTTSFSLFKRSVEEMPSPSVTPSGYLWQEALARMTHEESDLIPSSAVITNEEAQSSEELQKRDALLRLLEAWREEGDEQEQRETWEYLKQALDEDGLSL